MSALEGLRPDRPDRYFNLAELMLDEDTFVGSLVSRLDWIQGFAEQPHSCMPHHPNLSRYRSIPPVGQSRLVQRASRSNGDLILLADAIRAARFLRVNCQPQSRNTWLRSRLMPDPSLLVFEAWCRFGDRWLIHCSPCVRGFGRSPRFFPLGWNWNLMGSQPAVVLSRAVDQFPVLKPIRCLCSVKNPNRVGLTQSLPSLGCVQWST